MPIHETEAGKVVLHINDHSHVPDSPKKSMQHDGFDLGSKNWPDVHHSKIDWDVARRFLKTVYMDGSIKRTNLAMKAGVNYTACTKYTAWMLEINWVSMSDDNRIALTESGLQVCRRLFS